MRYVGVEEELLLVHTDTFEPCAMAAAVLAMADRAGAEDDIFQKELQRQQLEFATRPQSDMSALEAEIRRRRRESAEHAGKLGASVVALATSPLPVGPAISADERYRWMQQEFGLTALEQLTCGCHVHVSVESDEEGVAVVDRIRPWLAPLLAMSANSPFWQGLDTGYRSYRSRVWGRWPSAGPTEAFGSAERYHDHVADMIATGVVRDPGMVYFDARLSHNHPTVEVRVADVCLDASTTVLLAVLVRALVETAAREWREGVPPRPVGTGLLRLASWRAGRSGLDEALMHPDTMTPVPAQDALEELLAHVRGALEDVGDLQLAQEGMSRLLRTGNGARRQRELLQRTGDLKAVIADCVRRTQE
ncbi:glutamate--cysteine ligase [Streptomyces sp. B1I3]|uniref:glutamate--cysteine ligase 2 n=1 Tax=Streptomyces sp. B1I3 TaxID=3042264 RepID=UPI0027811D3C|nr:glutamate--cysteine ligase [Streptomyces sp. B1I3]MDQ0797844.1 carboxylate-amine ligase [Streptomyces sp. B1I3]